MLGKVVVVAGAGAAYLLRTRSGQQQVARVLDLLRARQRESAGATAVVDLRPVAALEHKPTPALLPDATPVEVARAVLADQPKH